VGGQMDHSKFVKENLTEWMDLLEAFL
jgi:hypothetical protein